MAAPLPPPQRKTLLEWIDQDDGHPPETAARKQSDASQALHARIVLITREQAEPIPPPSGLRLAPLG